MHSTVFCLFFTCVCYLVFTILTHTQTHKGEMNRIKSVLNTYEFDMFKSMCRMYIKFISHLPCTSQCCCQCYLDCIGFSNECVLYFSAWRWTHKYLRFLHSTHTGIWYGVHDFLFNWLNEDSQQCGSDWMILVKTSFILNCINIIKLLIISTIKNKFSCTQELSRYEKNERPTINSINRDLWIKYILQDDANACKKQ